MTRLFTLLGLRAAVRSDAFDAPDTQPMIHSGWHESSLELRRGLMVLEDDERDRGPETRPFTYQVETA